ncbi:MAG: ECF transporter S component [Oscillospiraceae bacterium]
MSKKTTQEKTKTLVQFSMMVAIEAIFCFTPLGSLPAFGPIVMTLAMLPVIVTAIVLGTKAGTLMGLIAGFFSFCVWTFMPPSPIAFVFTPFYSVGAFSGNFWSLVICFVPRMLVGLVTGLLFTMFKKAKANDFFCYSVSGFVGSMMNTLLVVAGIYLFFGEKYAEACGIGFELLLGLIGTTILTSGIPEAILGGLVAIGVGKPLIKYLTKGV